MRITYNEMNTRFLSVLSKYGFENERAALCAKLFTDASLDGVYTHGINRFPRFIDYIKKGYVKVNNKPSMTFSSGVLERWDGNEGPGNLNAFDSMNRAVAIAKENVIGCVALSNTNHWMRPGSYGLMAAEQNCIGLLWTNTMPNMPPWGGKEAKLGNNPVVIAVPNGDTPLLLDVAMSMFSYGKLEAYARQGKELPADGGFDSSGSLTKDASKILETRRTLPIGYWKGSGLSLALDLIAAALSGGNTSREVGMLPAETKLSQVFIAICLDKLPDQEQIRISIIDTLADLQASEPSGDIPVRYPGQGMFQIREENLKHGIPVEESIWEAVKAL